MHTMCRINPCNNCMQSASAAMRPPGLFCCNSPAHCLCLHSQAESTCWQAYLCADYKASNKAREDDDGLEHVEAIQRCHELVLHVLVVDDGFLQLLPLQLLIVEALDCLKVEQCIRHPCTPCIIVLVHFPAKAHHSSAEIEQRIHDSRLEDIANIC